MYITSELFRQWKHRYIHFKYHWAGPSSNKSYAFNTSSMMYCNPFTFTESHFYASPFEALLSTTAQSSHSTVQWRIFSVSIIADIHLSRPCIDPVSFADLLLPIDAVAATLWRFSERRNTSQWLCGAVSKHFAIQVLCMCCGRSYVALTHDLLYARLHVCLTILAAQRVRHRRRQSRANILIVGKVCRSALRSQCFSAVESFDQRSSSSSRTRAYIEWHELSYF